ncbi:MarR family transcriptional regulator [Paenibacillus graminis]|uniref:MarR family transcriptional regulator n=2 Tax=Paenibacillus graminis TaxID=189425 RepID=UPI00046FD402|nr:MarR family transcriptional regulator [Paenibacillus graminis]
MNTELYEKLAKLQWLLQRQHLKTHAAVGPMADTSRGQGRILAFLRMKDGISTKDLSYMLDIRVSSLNELLAKLEKAEYITRKPSETDKRIILIYLTQKGQEEEGQELDRGDIFSRLLPEEQVAYGEYTDRIIMTLEEELGTDAERDVTALWMEAAKERMGTEEFERLMSMRGQMSRMWEELGDGRFNGRFPGFGREGHGNGMHGFGRPSRDGGNSSPDKSHDQDDK